MTFFMHKDATEKAQRTGATEIAMERGEKTTEKIIRLMKGKGQLLVASF